jgi:integrase
MSFAIDSAPKPYLPVPPDRSGHLEQALAMQGLPAIEHHPALAYIRSLKTGDSRRTMIHSLNTIAEILDVNPIYSARPDRRSTQSERKVYRNLAWLFVPWHELRHEDTHAIRAALAERLSVGGANKALSALRRVLKEAWRLGQMSAEDYHAAVDLDNFKGGPQPTGRILTDTDVHRVLAECSNDTSAAGVRDAALIAFIWQSGARRSSVIQVELDHYDPVTGDGILYGAESTNERLFSLAGDARDLMNAWLALRGEHPGPVFQPITQTGEIERFDDAGAPWRMTPQAIYYILRKRAKEAGVEPFSPRDLRRASALS